MAARGTQLPQAKLNERLVQQMINERYIDGLSYRAIGRRHGVDGSTVWLAVNGLTWSHALVSIPPEADSC